MPAVRPVLLAALLLSAACGRAKAGDDAAVPADTAGAAVPTPLSVPAGAPVADSAPTVTPSAAPTSGGAGTSATPAGAAKPAPSPYIGRDSAFGPTYEVDSTGKVTPIRVKKPVNR